MVKKGMDAKKAVSALREILARHGRQELLPRIGRAFERIAKREQAKSAVVLSVAREKDARKAEREAKDFLKDVGVDAKEISIHIDDTLIGGWRIEGREHLHDASYKKSLLSMYNRSTQ